MSHKITIIRVRKNPEENINKELQWLGNSLGLFNVRDKDSSCFRVFITLVRKAKRNEPISSDDVADKLSLTRGTVVHHLNKLMESGIVIREKGGYLLRENSLQDLIKDMRRDMEGIFSQLLEVAKEVDNKLS
jgi:predicted transcriptional regulator